MSDLYEDDILLWSEQQAEALRRRAANEIDWDNIADEIEALGRSERNAVESHLQQALLHDLKVGGVAAVPRRAALACGGPRSSG